MYVHILNKAIDTQRMSLDYYDNNKLIRKTYIFSINTILDVIEDFGLLFTKGTPPGGAANIHHIVRHVTLCLNKTVHLAALLEVGVRVKLRHVRQRHLVQEPVLRL